MPTSRWYLMGNGAPDLHQSPAPSRLSWFQCTGRWRSRPHWKVSQPLRCNPPDCRRCRIASWWPRWRAGRAGAPFPPHLQKHKRWDVRFRGARGWCEKKSQMYLYIPARVGQSGDASYPAIWRVFRIIKYICIYIDQSYSVICRDLWKIQVRFFIDIKYNK